MRLIDADELIVIEYGGIKFVPKEFIDEAPTVDAVPVQHGRWVIDDEYIDCSVCRREKCSRVPFEDLVKGFKYCPKCGAKMDGGTA